MDSNLKVVYGPPRVLLDDKIIELAKFEVRQTSGRMLQTAFVLLPAKGCSYNCAHCKVKLYASFDDPLRDSWVTSRLEALDQYLEANQDLRAIRLFFSGNGFWPREVNPDFWVRLPAVLAKHRVQSVSVECRPDDLIDHVNMTHEKIVTRLADDLAAIRVQLRLIFGVEFISKAAVKATRKFPGWYTNDVETNLEKLVEYMNQIGVRYSAYAMFGGQYSDRAMTSAEAISETFRTYKFLSQLAFEEIIVNPQYADDELAAKVYVPNRLDVAELIRVIAPEIAYSSRLRVTLEAEDEGSHFMQLTESDRSLLLEFNQILSQRRFLMQRINEFNWE